MYIHIGNGESVKDKDIIGVFDLDTSTVSKITKGLFQKKKEKDSLNTAILIYRELLYLLNRIKKKRLY